MSAATTSDCSGTEKYWVDGKPVVAISNPTNFSQTNGTEKFWADGAPMDYVFANAGNSNFFFFF